MKLAELAFACFVYSRMSDYDSSYRSLLKATYPQIDLNIEYHRRVLLKWLNNWKCRQFAVEYHGLASAEIETWYKVNKNNLLSIDKTLISMTNSDIGAIKKVYSDLASKVASKRKLKEKFTKVEFGPTGAAKILFVLRPNTFIPWDQPIRDELELDGTADSYCDYLRIAKNHLNELSKDCERNGFDLADLPNILKRESSSIAKLIDEYYWVTITNGCEPPREKEFKRWVSWI